MYRHRRGRAHHVLHVRADGRIPVIVDLSAAPGRTLVFTRTKRGAKTLTRRLIAAGVPAVELHGSLAQNARRRNLLAFSEGTATTLVATDIAARGIHVDDIALVVHADPSVEHKAYLHRSGRTARGGAHGTVVTLMTGDQVGDVRELSRGAGIKPITTRLRPNDPILVKLAPGTRTYVAPASDSPPEPDTSCHGRARRQQKPTTSAPKVSARKSTTQGNRSVLVAEPGRRAGTAGLSARSRPRRGQGGR